MKIVITGGAGFIGSQIAEYFSLKGIKATVVDNLRSGYLDNLQGLNVDFIKGSVTDKDLMFRAMENADYVFHLAALVSVPESIEKPFETLDINVKGLLNVLEASKKCGVRKLVLSSSAAVYGDNPELPKTVSMKPEPKTPYSITKLDGEYYLRMYRECFGLPTAVLRYFNVFGPRQDPKGQYAAAVPIFIEKAIKNEPITIYGDGLQTRDFIYVKDVVQANWLAASNENALGVYNVANGLTITIKELAEKIIELTGSKSRIVFLPERPGDIKHSLASIEETKKDLGFKPSGNLEAGLIKTIEYFRTKIK